MRVSFYRRFLKRPMDIFLSLAAIVFLSFFLLLIALLVRLKLGSPVLFTQKRPGLDEKIFTLYKFRTMTDEKDKVGNLLSDKDRMTSFGRFLRSASLDELPELFNILKGDMSVVGPRPLLAEYLGLYNREQKKRHGVRPGLSGLAQISGRNAISWEDKFAKDVEYVDNINIWGDWGIIFRTVFKVFKREGVSKSEDVLMERFGKTKP